jgi:hypothetical protein
VFVDVIRDGVVTGSVVGDLASNLGLWDSVQWGEAKLIFEKN